MQNKIDPAFCDGKCESCPADPHCDHVLLTDSQKAAASVCGVCILVIAVVWIAAIVIQIVKALA